MYRYESSINFIFFTFFLCVRLYISTLRHTVIMNDPYSLEDSYKRTGAGIQEDLEAFAQKYVAGNAMLVLGLLIVLVVVIVWLLFWKAKETFNPTQNMRDQDSDQFGFGAKEKMDQPKRADSAFAQETQSAGIANVAGNGNAAGPGSAAYNVLHSADFNCDKRGNAENDAWGWMNGVAQENMTGAKPKDDNGFSKVLAGH